MGEKQGSKLMRSLYAAFYSGSITQLWPLRDWLDRTERQKLPGYTAATAEAEGASERAAALALKRVAMLFQLTGPGAGMEFPSSSRMMRTINCNQVSPSLREYNIGLDSDALALMMLRPLVVFVLNISNGNEFFNLYAIRLNKREATRRKKIRNFFSR